MTAAAMFFGGSDNGSNGAFPNVVVILASKRFTDVLERLLTAGWERQSPWDARQIVIEMESPDSTECYTEIRSTIFRVTFRCRRS